MRDYIRQIIESLVKNPARGVKAGTNMKITYRAGENLDRAMKYFDDFKSQQKKIQKLMHSAEMDSDGNLVITPRSTQGAKKIRSMMQDVLAPRKDEPTNENYDPNQLVKPSREDLDESDLVGHEDLSLRQIVIDANDLQPVSLSETEVDDLLAFLEALTDLSVMEDLELIPQSVPSGLPVKD